MTENPLDQTEQENRNAAEKETDEKIWKMKEDYSFDIDRVCAALLWEKACREQVAQNYSTELKKAERIAIATCRQEFADMVMNFSEGCDDGKIRFLKEYDLPVPERDYEVTIRFTAPHDVDLYDIASSTSDYVGETIDVTWSSVQNYEAVDDY